MSIKRKSDPYDPDYVIVVDETLLHSVNVTDGLDRNGAIIVNTPRPAREIRPLLRGYEGRVYTVDAREISERTLGKNFPNTPMLAAAAAVTGVMEKEDFLREMKASFAHKFAKKPEVIRGNMEALTAAYNKMEKDMEKAATIVMSAAPANRSSRKSAERTKQSA